MQEGDEEARNGHSEEDLRLKWPILKKISSHHTDRRPESFHQDFIG